MAAEVDISIYHFRRVVGQFAIIGAWAKTDDGWRRCLVLMRSWAYATNDMRVFVVHDDVDLPLWALDVPPFGDPKLAVAAARLACRSLDIDETMPNINRIITIVNDHLNDLIMMPPRPRTEEIVLGEFIITERETGKRTEVEIKADV